MQVSLRGESFFQNTDVQKLFRITKQLPLPFIEDMARITLSQNRQSILKNLNVKLFNLKLKSEILSDTSFEGVANLLTVISSSPHAISGIISSANTTDQLKRIVSLTSQEITGDSTANEYTKLNVQGEIIIQGKKIPIGFSPLLESSYSTGYDSLYSIARKINNSELNVTAKIINDRLVILSFQDISFADNTWGGKSNGLGLRMMPTKGEGEILTYFVKDTHIPKNLATTQKYSSYKISSITNNENATQLTPLYGVEGNLIINNVVISVNPGGVVDTAQTLINRINSTRNIGATAEFIDGRIVIKSSDLAKQLNITDETKGGYMQGLGLTRAGKKGNGDIMSSIWFEKHNVQIISLASYQKNISYSVQEITGDNSSDEKSALGLSGYLMINNTRIYIFPNYSLSDIKSLINILQKDVRAEISGKRLLLVNATQDRTYFNIDDKTSGGQRNGLGIGKDKREIIGLHPKIISGIPSADKDTILNISGILRINDKIINIGREYETMTLSKIADRINSIYDIGVTATIEDNKLVIRSNNDIDFVDETVGGFGGLQGALGLSYRDVNYISQPHNAVFSVDGKIYSSTSNFTSDGVPLAKFILKSEMNEENIASLQLTSFNNVSAIKKNIVELINEYNSIMQDLNKLTAILPNSFITEGLFFRNITFEKLKQELKNIFQDKTKEDLNKIGFVFNKNGEITINEKVFQENLDKNLLKVINIFNSQEDGITKRINDLFKNIVLSDGIPNVDVRDESKYSFYRNVGYFSLLSHKISQRKGYLINIMI